MSEWMVTGSDLDNYLQACKTADINNFKRDDRLTKIFEHSTKNQAWDYFHQIVAQNKWLLKKPFTNDDKGNPMVRCFGEYYFSPSTLQYIGVLSNLITWFGPLDGKRIVEIGGGYGGQCKTIMDVYKPACYHIIDLPEVCELQRRYCQAKCFTTPTLEKYDLVISNYAISEIKENEVYMEQVVKQSKHGYLTCNTDYVQLDFQHKRLPDVPSEAAKNYILIW